MISFTDEQMQFLNSHGKVVLHACPGSGKTAVVAQKMIDYLKQWNRPHRGIATLSFTNVAIDEIRRRALDLLSAGNIGTPHFIGTLDSFINNYIFLRFGYLLSERQQRPSIVSGDIVSSYHCWKQDCYRKCLPRIEDFRWNSNWELMRGAKNVTCSTPGFPCLQFKNSLLKNNQFFQSEIASIACILLKKYPQIAQCIASRFPIIILDEAQDASLEQMKILDILSESGLESIFIVGDPDQAIYEWRNANPECFRKKMQDPEWQSLSLTKNFRSSQLICNATFVFSDVHKHKTATQAIGPCASYNKKPILFLYQEGLNPEHVIDRFKKECISCNISLSPTTVAVVTRKSIHSDNVEDLWKTTETRLLAKASFEWFMKNPRDAYLSCEQALFQLFIKDLNDVKVSIEQEISKAFPSQKWRNIVTNVLVRLPSALEQCGQWVTLARTALQEVVDSFHLTLISNKTVSEAIKIKTRDRYHPQFKHIPIKNYFEKKHQSDYTQSSIHGVKGETFDAIMVLVEKAKGPGFSTSFLTSGKTKEELMRIAYVAMTRPRKLLVIAMPIPSELSGLESAFPKDKWDHIEI